MSKDRYNVIRYVIEDTDNYIILENVTLEEAQEHCNREDTSGDGWFDGYTRIVEDE